MENWEKAIRSFPYDKNSIYEAEERLRSLTRKYPHHGIVNWKLIQISFGRLIGQNRNMIDIASGRTLRAKCKNLLVFFVKNYVPFKGNFCNSL